MNSVAPTNSQILPVVQNLSSVATAHPNKCTPPLVPQHGLGKLSPTAAGREKEPHGCWAVRLHFLLCGDLMVLALALLPQTPVLPSVKWVW